MATKIDEKRTADNVEAAIRSLYKKFPDAPSTKYGRTELKTKETAAIRRKITKRKDELAADKQLKSLEKELKDATCTTSAAMRSQHYRVDTLLRKFQVRGVTPDLLDEIDALSAEEPAAGEEYGCGCGDES